MTNPSADIGDLSAADHRRQITLNPIKYKFEHLFEELCNISLSTDNRRSDLTKDPVTPSRSGEGQIALRKESNDEQPPNA